MKELYKGKTKDVYEQDDGAILLRFKDDACGAGGVFDPGANTVGLSIEGLGKSGLRVSDYFFRKFKEAGVPTHYLSADLDAGTMTVLPAKTFGKGVEFICRFCSTGSFMRRYGLYAQEGQALDALVEVTLKDDGRDDPPITRDTLEALGILTGEEHDILKALARRVSLLIKDDLAGKGMELYDVKLEFGRVGEKGELALIDEISAGNMRVYKDGRQLEPLELNRLAPG